MQKTNIKSYLSLFGILFILSSCQWAKKELYREEISYNYYEAQRYYDEGDMEKASQYFKKCQSLDPQLAEAYYGAGTAYFSDQKYSKASEELEQAYKLSPEKPEIIYWLAKSYHRLGKIQEAGAIYKKALSFNPNLPPLEEKQEDLEKQKDETRSIIKPVIVFEELKRLFEKGYYTEVLEILKDKREHFLLLCHALAFLYIDKVEEGNKEILSLVPLLLEEPDGFYPSPEATQWLDSRLIETGSKSPLAISLRAIYLLALKNPSEPHIDLLNRAIAIEGNKEMLSALYLSRGKLYKEISEDDKAFSDLENAVFMNPGSSKAHLYLGFVYLRRGDLFKAKKCFINVCAIDPKNQKAKALIEGPLALIGEENSLQNIKEEKQ